MATYLELQNDVKNLINRSDCTTDLAKSFLKSASQKIQRTLRFPGLEKLFSITVGTTSSQLYDQAGGKVYIPGDYIEMVQAYTGLTQSNDAVLNRVPLSRFIELSGSLPQTGKPQYYTRLQNFWYVKPIPTVGTVFHFVYRGEAETLTNDTDTNTLSLVSPDLITYGACIYASDYFNDDRKANYEASYNQIKLEIEELILSTDQASVDASVQPSVSFELDIIN